MRASHTDDDLQSLLLTEYRSIQGYAGIDGWWRDASIIRDLGPALAALFPDARPTVVLGIEARGFFLAGLVAVHLDVGVVQVSKGRRGVDLSPQFRTRTTPPDYRDRSLPLSMARWVLKDSDRVLLVDDWIQTGAQATVAAQLVADVGARWEGAAVIVDNCEWTVRRRLNVRSLLRAHQLPD